MTRASDFENEGQSTATDRDNSIVAAVRRGLQDGPYRSLARLVSFTFHEGVLTLRGKVPTYFHKQMAQALLQRTPGVEELVNRLEVT